MNALRLRAMGNRLLGDDNGCDIALEDTPNEYKAVIIDPIARLGRWFQKDATDPKGRTNVYFQMEVRGENEDWANQQLEDFALGARFMYNGTLYSVERLMPVRIQNLTIFMYLIADPL